MTKHQQIAIENHCRLGFETAHPRFGWADYKRGVTCVLTVNSGYE